MGEKGCQNCFFWAAVLWRIPPDMSSLVCINAISESTTTAGHHQPGAVILFLALTRALDQRDLLFFPALFCLCTSLLSLLVACMPLREKKYSASCNAVTSLSNASPRARTHETQGWTESLIFTLLFFQWWNCKMMCPKMLGNPRQITKQKWVAESVL